jgi:hypothetical protein
MGCFLDLMGGKGAPWDGLSIWFGDSDEGEEDEEGDFV